MKKSVYKNSIKSILTAIFRLLLIPAFTGLLAVSEALADHEDSGSQHKRYLDGKKTFGEYCARCHGVNGDGRGPVAPLFIKLKTPRPSNFKIKFYTIRPAEYLASIIRDGGEAHSLSKSMPPFGQELSNSDIDNVVHYIKNISRHANENKGQVAER